MGGLTTPLLRQGMLRIVAELERRADELNALDAILGDGDLGVSLVRGARSVTVVLPELPDDDLGRALALCARAITSISGSTFGTLLAAGMLSAAKRCNSRREVPWSEFPLLLEDFGDAIAKRGKCQLGDKTLLDSVQAASVSIRGMDDPIAMLNNAEVAVEDAVEGLRHQASRQGRARMFPDRSIGTPDPGMVAFSHILRALR